MKLIPAILRGKSAWASAQNEKLFMTNFMKIALISTAFLFTLFAMVVISTGIGGVAGVVVGWVFPSSITAVKTILGITCTNFEVGAALGFIGGFFKAATTRSD